MKPQPAPPTTVFSINPETQKPYLEPEHAMKLACKHIITKAPFLLNDSDLEDIRSYFMIRLCATRYNPAKCAAPTFAIMIFQSSTLQLNSQRFAKCRTVAGNNPTNKSGKFWLNQRPAISSNIQTHGSERMDLYDLASDGSNPEEILISRMFSEP